MLQLFHRILPRALAPLTALLLSGCVGLLPGAPGGFGGAQTWSGIATASGRSLPNSAPVVQAAMRIEPVAEALCREQLAASKCDFQIAVDDDPREPANAFQTLDPQGRPVIVFTQALLDLARNTDELAFVMGHEAAHHIAGHIPRRQDQAKTGAILVGILGQASGLQGADLVRVQEIGAGLASQQYSKEFELEADRIGAKIAYQAGFDPLLGAAFFSRLPDPGDRAMGSHPANAQRQAVVASTVRQLRGY